MFRRRITCVSLGFPEFEAQNQMFSIGFLEVDVQNHCFDDPWSCQKCVQFFKHNADPENKCTICCSGEHGYCPTEERMPFWQLRIFTIRYCRRCMSIPDVWLCRKCKADLYWRHQEKPKGNDALCSSCSPLGPHA